MYKNPGQNRTKSDFSDEQNVQFWTTNFLGPYRPYMTKKFIVWDVINADYAI